MSGPLSISRIEMQLLRRIENIELAIEGRDNRWSGVRQLVAGGSDTATAMREMKHGGRDYSGDRKEDDRG